MKEAIDPARPLYVTDESRGQITKFLGELMYAVQIREWENSARMSAFGMTTLLQAHFPRLMVFLDECLVKKTACLEATVNVDRFLYHLTTLKVFIKGVSFLFLGHVHRSWL